MRRRVVWGGPRTPGLVTQPRRDGRHRRAEGQHAVLSASAADYLERIATDGTLEAALNEIAAAEPELAG